MVTGPIFHKASAATLRTPESSSRSNSISAEIAVFASGPIFPTATAAVLRTAGSLSPEQFNKCRDGRIRFRSHFPQGPGGIITNFCVFIPE